MKKSELACSIPIAKLLSNIPEDAEIGSLAVFASVKGRGVFMGSQMSPNAEEIAGMLSAFAEAKNSVIESVIQDHGREMMVSVMFYLASSNPESKSSRLDSEELFEKFFAPGSGEEE